jgi:hypothetical protein
MRNFCLVLLSLLSFSLSAQNLEGNWLLAYIVSTPPEMTIGEDGVDFVIKDESEEIESFVEQGLMLLSILPNGKATSFYSDVKEEWKVVQNGNQVTFESAADTLYGKYNNKGMLQLRSVIDEFPTEYHFAPYSPTIFDLKLSNTSWKVKDEGFLNGKTFEFQSGENLRIWTDGKAKETDYFFIPLGNYYAIEFSSGESDTGFGIIYLESFNGKTLTGIIYIIEQDEAPQRVKVVLSKL